MRTAESQSSVSSARSRFWLLTGILLLAAALRLAHAGVESLWFDEAFTVIASRTDIASILQGEADPVLPPFYFVALHLWQTAVGESELAVRFFSGLCSLLAVAGIHRLGSRLYNRRAGIWAAGLMAVAPFQIYYAQETRVYALCVLLAVGLLWAFLEAIMRPRLGAWVAYICLAILGLYTHYFFGMVLAALHVWAAIYHRRWAAWRVLLASDLWVMVLFLPGAGLAWSRVRAVTTGFWIERPSVLATVKTFDFLLFASTTPRWLVPVALFGTMGLLAVVALDLPRICRSDRTRRPAIRFCLLVVGLPIAVGFAISQLGGSIYLDRSFALVTPAYLLLLAFGLAVRPRGSPSLVLTVVLGLVAVMSLASFYCQSDVAKPRFREAGDFLTERAEPGDVLLHLHDSTFFSMRYYVPEMEAFVLEGDLPWLLPEAWPRFGTHVTADWLATRPAGNRLWVAVEPRLYDQRQQVVLDNIRESWRPLARFTALGIQLHLFQSRTEVESR